MEKPLDYPHPCTLRISWVVDRYGLLIRGYSPVAYITEKCFHKVNRCRAMKVLPKGEHESENKGELTFPNMLSRRFPVKTMFMTTVGQPLVHRHIF